MGDSLFCKLYVENVRYVLGAVYRPPSLPATILEVSEEYLHSYVKVEGKLIPAGDFNLPNIYLCNFCCQSSLLVNNKMLDIAFTFDLLQVIDNYTRIQNGSQATLDLVFVSGTIKNKVSCEVTAGISDHLAVVLTLLNVPPTSLDRVQFIQIFQRPMMKLFLTFTTIHSAFPCDINNLWFIFKDIVFDCIHHFVPKIAKKSSNYSHWVTREALQLQRNLKCLKKK